MNDRIVSFKFPRSSGSALELARQGGRGRFAWEPATTHRRQEAFGQRPSLRGAEGLELG
jgi:hypothetical protein